MENTMSIEAALAANTAALEENTAVQEKVLAAFMSGSGAKAPAKPAAKSAEEKAPAKKAPVKKAATKKAPTEEDIRKMFGPYLAGATDKAEKSRINATIKPILAHFGAEKITEIASDNWVEALGYGQQLVDAFNEGGLDAAEAVTFDFMNEEDGDEDEDDDGIL